MIVPGVRLGVDVGDARVGLARSDRDGLLATPIDTLPRDTSIAGIVDAVEETGARAIMVGLPRSLSGGEGPAAAKIRGYVQELYVALRARGLQDLEIRLVDERLTTVTAHQALHRSGRKEKKHRSVVDQVAAVMILQQALDQERATGAPAGEATTAQDEEDVVKGDRA
jgi:putative Holliday junction resolvase